MHHREKDEDHYVVPGGGVEPGETPEQTAVREAKEETGLTVELNRKLRVVDDNGGPEQERTSAENRYDLEWVEIRRLRSLDLRPADIFAVCESGLGRRTRSG